jgi:hypothetical protein
VPQQPQRLLLKQFATAHGARNTATRALHHYYCHKSTKGNSHRQDQYSNDQQFVFAQWAKYPSVD